MKADWTPFIGRVIDKYEGAYGWDRQDPGGPTKYGVTCYDLAEHRGQAMTSMGAWAPLVQQMSRAEAEDIYAKKYAAGIRFDDLGPGKDTVMADYAINSGVSRPILVASRLLGLPATSRMTDTLIAAINKAEPLWFIQSMCAERLHFMHGIRGGSAWTRFGHGWGARVADIEAYSDRLANGASPLPAPDLSKVPTPKARHKDPRLGKKATTTAGSAPVNTGVAHALGAPVWVLITIAVLTVAGAIGWYFYQKHKNAKADTTVVLPPGVTAIGAAS